MTGPSRVMALCVAGAVFGFLMIVFSPLADMGDLPDAARGAIAGGLFGGAIAILALVRDGRQGGGAPALLLANPLVSCAFLLGEEAARLLAAATMIAGPALALAGLRDYRAAIALGMTLALAPFLSSAVLYLYPVLMVALPLISPWGLAPRKAAGFAVVVWSPAVMVLAGLSYLRWLLAPSGGGPIDIAFNDAFAGVVAIAGAGVAALAAFAASRRAAIFAFLAGGGLLALLLRFWNGGF